MGAGERTNLLGAAFVLSCGGSSRFGVMHQLSEDLFRKCTCLPPQPLTRTRSARVRCFSFFAFTSSPYDGKKQGNSDFAGVGKG